MHSASLSHITGNIAVANHEESAGQWDWNTARCLAYNTINANHIAKPTLLRPVGGTLDGTAGLSVFLLGVSQR